MNFIIVIILVYLLMRIDHLITLDAGIDHWIDRNSWGTFMG